MNSIVHVKNLNILQLSHLLNKLLKIDIYAITILWLYFP